MNNLTKSVKLIGEVVYLMLGADFTRPIDTELIKILVSITFVIKIVKKAWAEIKSRRPKDIRLNMEVG